MAFELNYDYHVQILYEEDVDPRFQSKLADKLLIELRELMILCCKNIYHTQMLQ